MNTDFGVIKMFYRLMSILSVSFLCFACAEFKEGGLDALHAEKKTNKDTFQKKIINGSLDVVHSSVVAVLMDYGECTGTIISPTVVLTAAHCVMENGESLNPREVWVTNSIQQGPIEAAAVTQYAVHPGWATQDSSAHDVALLLLDRPLQTTPMPLHFGAATSLLGEVIQAVGFGVTNGWTQTGGGEKRATTMVITETFYGSFDVSSPSGRQTDTCQGDSGGPAIITLNGVEHVLGVVSRGPEGCTGLTEYAALDDKMSWIAQTMGGSSINSTPSAPSSSSAQAQSNEQGRRVACPYINDGECDEPTYCDYGTDTADCSQSSATQSAQSNQQSAQPAQSNQQSAPANAMQGVDSCRYAFDGICDEPYFCESGTDTTDCSPTSTQGPTPQGGNTGGYSSNSNSPSATASNGANSCRWANDGECDEPTYCAFGTDTADCQNAQNSATNWSPGAQTGFGDSCRYAHDGVCDEPTYCDYGTDQTDCANQATPTQAAPAQPSSSSRPYESSCVWANDGECDEPTYCAFGTDGSDCD